jgi:glutamine synthetase type III
MPEQVERFLQGFRRILRRKLPPECFDFVTSDTSQFCEVQEEHETRMVGSNEGKEMLDLETNFLASFPIDAKPNTRCKPVANTGSLSSLRIEIHKEFIAKAIVTDDWICQRIIAKR